MSFNFKDFHTDAAKTVEHFRQTVGMLRTGRASADMLDTVMVEAYGTRMRLVEVASISVPDATLIVITPWDKSLIKAIETAIATTHDLELNPVVDGQIIRIPVATLTEERRKEMVKLLHKRAEESKVMMRSVRTTTKKEIESAEGNEGVSEDNIRADVENLEVELKKYMDQIDAITTQKEKELMTI